MAQVGLSVGELKKALENVPDDTPVGLSVFRHSWFANRHLQTHGDARIAIGRFTNDEKILMIYEGDWPTNGYTLEKLGD